MDSKKILRSLISLCLILVHSNPAYSDDDVYDVLKDYNLPVGILPKGVTGFEFERSTDELSVHFRDTCSFSEGKYQLKYESTVKGFISKGKLSRLEGVTVKFAEDWMNIVEILRRGSNIEFSAAAGKVTFADEFFEECPQCGCGMKCSRGSARKLMEN